MPSKEGKGLKSSWSNWFLCTSYRKVEIGVEDWGAELRHKCSPMRSKAGRERREALEEEEKEETEGSLKKVEEEEGVGKEALRRR